MTLLSSQRPSLWNTVMSAGAARRLEAAPDVGEIDGQERVAVGHQERRLERAAIQREAQRARRAAQGGPLVDDAHA